MHNLYEIVYNVREPKINLVKDVVFVSEKHIHFKSNTCYNGDLSFICK